MSKKAGRQSGKKEAEMSTTERELALVVKAQKKRKPPKANPTVTPSELPENGAGPQAPEPAPVTEKAERKEPLPGGWERLVPYAADVKAKGLQVQCGDYTVAYNKEEDAPKDQRWVVTEGGALVAYFSQYWPACLDARRRSRGAVSAVAGR